jgi:hypothetical protein
VPSVLLGPAGLTLAPFQDEKVCQNICSKRKRGKAVKTLPAEPALSSLMDRRLTLSLHSAPEEQTCSQLETLTVYF